MHAVIKAMSTIWFVIGAVILYFALTMETTVIGYSPEPTANLQLMHFQLVGVLLGSFSILSSMVLLGAQAIVEQLQKPKP